MYMANSILDFCGIWSLFANPVTYTTFSRVSSQGQLKFTGPKNEGGVRLHRDGCLLGRLRYLVVSLSEGRLSQHFPASLVVQGTGCLQRYLDVPTLQSQSKLGPLICDTMEGNLGREGGREGRGGGREGHSLHVQFNSYTVHIQP